MTTRLEVYVPHSQTWEMMGELKPGEKGSLSNVLPDKDREVLLFECAPDNSKSTISVSTYGEDDVIGDTKQTREVAAVPSYRKVIKELHTGESHVATIKPDNSPQARTIRFSHLK